jgi:hypothetical protein
MPKPLQQFEYGRKENIIKAGIFLDPHSHIPNSGPKDN